MHLNALPSTLLPLLLLPNLLLALPTSILPRQTSPPRPLTASVLTTINPATASCGGAPFPEECRTADQAVDPLLRSFARYGISTAGEQAALLALMLFETDGFRYAKNHFPAPGNPGQGTRNLQSPTYNSLYLSSLSTPSYSSSSSPPLFDHATAAAALAVGPVATLNLLLSNADADFGSAAWFLASQCSAQVRQGLAAGSWEGWRAYLTRCVGTTGTEARDAVWNAVRKGWLGGY